MSSDTPMQTLGRAAELKGYQLHLHALPTIYGPEGDILKESRLTNLAVYDPRSNRIVGAIVIDASGPQQAAQRLIEKGTP